MSNHSIILTNPKTSNSFKINNHKIHLKKSQLQLKTFRNPKRKRRETLISQMVVGSVTNAKTTTSKGEKNVSDARSQRVTRILMASPITWLSQLKKRLPLDLLNQRSIRLTKLLRELFKLSNNRKFKEKLRFKQPKLLKWTWPIPMPVKINLWPKIQWVTWCHHKASSNNNNAK